MILYVFSKGHHVCSGPPDTPPAAPGPGSGPGSEEVSALIEHLNRFIAAFCSGIFDYVHSLSSTLVDLFYFPVEINFDLCPFVRKKNASIIVD